MWIRALIPCVGSTFDHGVISFPFRLVVYPLQLMGLALEQRASIRHRNIKEDQQAFSREVGAGTDFDAVHSSEFAQAAAKAFMQVETSPAYILSPAAIARWVGVWGMEVMS